MDDGSLESLLNAWNLSECVPYFKSYQITLNTLGAVPENYIQLLAPSAELQVKVRNLIGYVKNNNVFKQIAQKNRELDDRMQINKNLNAKIVELGSEIKENSLVITNLEKEIVASKIQLKRQIETEGLQSAKRMCLQAPANQKIVNCPTISTLVIANGDVNINNAIPISNETILLQVVDPGANGHISMPVITRQASHGQVTPFDAKKATTVMKLLPDERIRFVEHKYKFEVVEILSGAFNYTVRRGLSKPVQMKFTISPLATDLLCEDDSLFRVIVRISRYRTAKQKKFYDMVPSKLKVFYGNDFEVEIKTKKEFYEAPLDVTEECCEYTKDDHFIQLDVEENSNQSFSVVAGVYMVRLLTFDEAIATFIRTRKERTVSACMKKVMCSMRSNDDISAQSLSISLICQLSKKRIEIPVVGNECTHVACFDLKSFIACNLNTLLWQCPLCDMAIKPDGLINDAYIADRLKRNPNLTKIEFDAAGRAVNSPEVKVAEVDYISID